MYLDTKIKSECYGCSACEQICHVKAITMQPDKAGFLYPVINHDLCIECGACRKVCPNEYPQFLNSNTPDVYAVYHKNVEVRQKSSSGGLFYAIAESVINKGGIVYGAAFDQDLYLSHKGVASVEKLDDLRGSKYVQSNLKDTFREIKLNLQAKREVYFVGTPCQIAGLKAYLVREYPNLVTSDLVCHGIPSQKLFHLHLDYIQSMHGAKVKDYKFRDLKKWGGCEAYKLDNGKQIYLPSYNLSPYLYSFMHAYTSRDSCYDCKFARIPRQGDITLADFWGVKNFFPYFDTRFGVSMIIINSSKGYALWNRIKKYCEYQKSSIEEGAQYNPNLLKSTSRPALRSVIYDEIDKLGYCKVARTYFRPDCFYLRKLYYHIKYSNMLNNRIVHKIISIIKSCR